MSPLAKILLAALAATGATALPLGEFPKLVPRGSQVPSSTSSSVAPAPTGSSSAGPASVDPAFITTLELAPTEVDRFKTLVSAPGGQQNLVFDFNKSAPPTGKGGNVVLANRKTFPAVIDLGIAAAVGTLDPCGMNTAHVHPRATEFLVVVEGQIESGFILENGLTTEMDTNLSKFQGTVFPQGSIHYQFNPTCEPAIFVSGLNSEDPGVSQIAQNFFGLNADIVTATLGFPESIAGEDIETFRNTIPPNVALGIESCLATCGIPKK